MNEQRQVVGVGNVFFFLYTLPLTLVGVVWLYRITDWGRLFTNWQGMLLMAVLLIAFSRLNFYTIVEIHPGTFANSDSSLSGVILWSGLLVFGPDVLWLPLVGKLAELIWQLRSATTTASRWVFLRIFTLYIAAVILSSLIAIRFYQAWGGQIPLPSLLFEDVGIAVAAVGLHVSLFALIYAGFILYIVWAQGVITAVESRQRIVLFFLLALGVPFLAYPFGVLAAGIYVQNNFFSYLFFVTGIALVSLLSRQLSRVAESSRQQSRQLLQLEALSRAIITGSPGIADLPAHLTDHVPSMFPSARVIIWAVPDEFLLRHPAEWYPAVDRFWDWLVGQPATLIFKADVELPWREVQAPHNPIIAAPILAVETQTLIGFIYIELQALVQPWDERSLRRLLPGVNSLSAQVASALRQAEVYLEALDFQRAVQELEFASEIQASFFPDEIPILPGWELAVTILPARQMAGDFFDFIPLDDNRLGILIADVTDKGVGPALYMALSRTLIRTYATEYQFEPDTVFFAANRRILKDARARLFVTVFFGVLNTETGVMTYSNAGHNPPYLLRADGVTVEPLGVTGMPIGIEEEAIWEQRDVQLDPGDVLLLYTDGIPDALNEEGEFFEEETFIDVAQLNATAPAYEIQAAIIEQLQQFVGEAPQVDDITLLILKRED